MFVLLPLAVSVATLALYIWNPTLSPDGADAFALPAVVIPGVLAAVHIALSLRIHQRIEAGLGLMYLLAGIPLFLEIDSATVCVFPAVTALLLAAAVAQATDRSLAEVVWFSLLVALAIGTAGLSLVGPDWSASPVFTDFDPFDTAITVPDIAAASFLVAAVVSMILPPARLRPVRSAHVCAMPVFFALLQRGTILDAPRFPFFAEVSMTSIFIILILGVTQLYWRHAFIDELTGLPNRRSLEERLKLLGKSFSIAMIDIDHFKSFNDTYGHAEGDNVLRWVAGALMRSASRRVYRYGGEEFCVVYGKLSQKEAATNVEQIREAVAERKFYIRVRGTAGKRSGTKKQRGRSPRRTSVSVTISCGVAESSKDERKGHDVISAADRALYQAKADGRNRVCVAKTS